MKSWLNKLGRIWDILWDRSEEFQDNPLFRYEIILNIIKE